MTTATVNACAQATWTATTRPGTGYPDRFRERRCEARVAIRDTVIHTIRETPASAAALARPSGPVKRVLIGAGVIAAGAALFILR